MFDKIFGAIKKDQGVQHLTSLMNAMNQLVAHFGAEYVTNPAARDDAIDGICQFLQGQKANANPQPTPPIAS